MFKESSPASLEPERDPARHRFIIRTADGIAELRYREREPKTLVLIHTEVPEALAGRGLASRLARAALDYARADGMKVVPECPFVRAYIERHPEYRDLVAKS